MMQVAVSIDQDGRGRDFLETNLIPHDQFYFVGVDGRQLSASDYFKIGVSGRIKPMTPAEVGCALSHLRAYAKFLASSENYLLVLEDDVKLVAPIELVQSLISQLPDGPVLLHLGGQEGLAGRRRLRGTPFGMSGVWRLDPEATRWLWRTCGYVVNREMAEIIMKRQRPLRNADSWRDFIANCDALVLYYPVVEHPVDLSTSLIEAERRGIGPGSKLKIWASKIEGLFVSLKLMMLGRRRIHRRSTR